jgi:heme exporter protein C
VLWLLPRTRSTTWDLLAGASAEVGVLFTGLTLAMGSIWGKPIWGSWWEWDARLTTTAVLFFLYLGYLALRRAGGGPDQRAKRSAIAALVAFVDVPIVHFSVNWFQTLHQDGTVFNRKMHVEISGTMAATLVLAVVAFTLLYAYLCTRRMELLQLEEGFEERELARAIEERIAQDTPGLSSEPSPEPMVGV